MAALGNAAPLATGDPTFCSGCGACLSALSILRPAGDDTSSIVGSDGGTSSRAPTGEVEGMKGTDKIEFRKGSIAPHEEADGMYVWICEFCSAVNQVDLDDMEKPRPGQDSVDYVLEAAAPASASAAGRDGGGNGENGKVWYCRTWPERVSFASTQCSTICMVSPERGMGEVVLSTTLGKECNIWIERGQYFEAIGSCMLICCPRYSLRLDRRKTSLHVVGM